jgi:phosphatidylglycerophosphatase A
VLAWFYDQQLMLEGIFWSFLASLLARGLMKAWIPTLISAAAFAVVYWPLHLNWMRSILIAVGVWLIMRALVQRGEPKVDESKPGEI